MFCPISTLEVRLARWQNTDMCFQSPEIDGPRQVEVKDVTDSSALVSWSEPTVPSDSVTMFYGPSSNPSEGTSVEIVAPDKQYSLASLRPDTEYNVSLISRSGEIASDTVTTTFTTGAVSYGNQNSLTLLRIFVLLRVIMSHFHS